MKSILPLLVVLLYGIPAFAQSENLKAEVARRVTELTPAAVEWRHHLHRNPELSNREYKTAAFVEAHLRRIGVEVRTQVAHTGVIGVLKGGRPGPVVALRADMDALPVEERVALPWASQARGEYNGDSVSVMHACGHDLHVATLLGTAEILAGMKDRLSGTIVFIFQPAEEGAPRGEMGGAEMMIMEGALSNPKVDVIFGLHVRSMVEVGKIHYKPASLLAATNTFTMKIHGKQTHGSTPWLGVDPIVAAAQIIIGLQTIVSRQMDLSKEPVVISVGKITGGIRQNIIPEEVTLVGTIRTLDTEMQRIVHEKVRHTATTIAESMGATVEIEIEKGYPVTFNNIELTRKMLPTLEEAVGGEENLTVARPITGAEDFAFFAQQVPGLFFFLGGMRPGLDPADAPSHHTPDFRVEDECIPVGMRALAFLALDYMAMNAR
jgi:amidohydrolase